MIIYSRKKTTNNKKPVVEEKKPVIVTESVSKKTYKKAKTPKAILEEIEKEFGER